MRPIPRPPDLDRHVRVGKNANDVYDMTGWVDPEGHHPGDGIPRVLPSANGWTLWLLVRHEGEVVLTGVPLDGVPFPVDEDVALALSLWYLATCENCVGRAARPT